jgi:hypothetical protein
MMSTSQEISRNLKKSQEISRNLKKSQEISRNQKKKGRKGKQIWEIFGRP